MELHKKGIFTLFPLWFCILISITEGCQRKGLLGKEIHSFLHDKKHGGGEQLTEVHHHHYNEGQPLPHPESFKSPGPPYPEELSEEPVKHVVVIQQQPHPHPPYQDDGKSESHIFKKLHAKHFLKHMHKLKAKFRALLFDDGPPPPQPHHFVYPQKVAVPAIKVPLVQVEAYKAAPPGHYPVKQNYKTAAYFSPDGHQPAVVVKQNTHPVHQPHLHQHSQQEVGQPHPHPHPLNQPHLHQHSQQEVGQPHPHPHLHTHSQPHPHSFPHPQQEAYQPGAPPPGSFYQPQQAQPQHGSIYSPQQLQHQEPYTPHGAYPRPQGEIAYQPQSQPYPVQYSPQPGIKGHQGGNAYGPQSYQPTSPLSLYGGGQPPQGTSFPSSSNGGFYGQSSQAGFGGGSGSLFPSGDLNGFGHSSLF